MDFAGLKIDSILYAFVLSLFFLFDLDLIHERLLTNYLWSYSLSETSFAKLLELYNFWYLACLDVYPEKYKKGQRRSAYHINVAKHMLEG